MRWYRENSPHPSINGLISLFILIYFMNGHAELYAVDLQVMDAPEDQKFNFGEQLLKALFAGWVKALERLYLAKGPNATPALEK